jgi:hypothetical protein
MVWLLGDPEPVKQHGKLWAFTAWDPKAAKYDKPTIRAK